MRNTAAAQMALVKILPVMPGISGGAVEAVVTASIDGKTVSQQQVCPVPAHTC